MKHGIGRLELDGHGRWTAHVKIDGVVAQWVVANPEAIPASQRDDCEYHLFRLLPDDQFCQYVCQDEVEDAFAQYQCYLDANGYRSYQDAINYSPH